MFHQDLSHDQARAYLQQADFRMPADTLTLERRDDRWLASWPDEHLAWFAGSHAAALRMANERLVLDSIRGCCGFCVPQVAHVAKNGSFDVRSRIYGLVSPVQLLLRLRADSGLTDIAARWLGNALAELHGCRINANTQALPDHPGWPEPARWIRARLPRVTTDQILLAEIDQLLDCYPQTFGASVDPVLIHGDFGLHNLVVDPVTWAPTGIIDFESAALADRHLDFRYLLLDFDDMRLLKIAMAVYTAATGVTLFLPRILLANAAAACCYLAYRDGIAPERSWCGRTLAEDMAWTRQALAHAKPFIDAS